MVSDISSIVNSASVGGTVSHAVSSVTVPRQVAGGPIPTSAAQAAGGSEARLQVAGNLDNLRTALESLGTAARDVRAHGEQLQQLEQHLNGARGALVGFVKIYPPLPLDSDERVQRLQSYSGYRQLVAALTLNPSEAQWPPVFQGGASAQDGSPSVAGPDNRGAGLTLSLAGGEQVQLPSQLQLPGEMVVPALPELGERASDEAVVVAVGQLDTFIAQVSQARQEHAEGFDQALAAIRLAGESLPIEVGQQAAEAAQRLRDQLAQIGGSLGSVPSDNTPLLKA